MARIYACILKEETEAVGVLNEIAGWFDDGTLCAPPFFFVASSTNGLYWRRDSEFARIRVGSTLTAIDGAELREIWTINFEVSDTESPDTVAFCWEIAVAISAFHPLPFWLSRECFGERDLESFGPVRSLSLSPAEVGFLLSGEQFDRQTPHRGTL